MATVELEHIDKTYPGGARAVIDCNLGVADGELLVLVGPSGCGKSTVLRMVAGLEEVSAGTIRIGGKVANDLTPQQRNVAMVFQDYALYPFLSVRGNLEFPLKMRGMPRPERARRAAATAALLNLTPLLERLPKQISGGERQRVAMGRALVREPAVFLLDEPLSNLDAKLRVQMRAEIGTLQRRTRTTMLYVTHDQVEAMTLGDRVALLDRGRLQQIGTPRELYERPANVFVAGFVGTPPMNLFAARASRDGEALILQVADQHLRLPGADRLSPGAEGALTIGIRPESLAPVSRGADDALTGTLEQLELLGHESLLHVRIADGIALIGRVDGMSDLTVGASISLRIAPDALHIFGPDGTALR